MVPQITLTEPSPTSTTRTPQPELQRWVCWPDPDRACLEARCYSCVPSDDATPEQIRRRHRRMTRDQVQTYAVSNGMVVPPALLEHGMWSCRVRPT